MIIQEKLKIAAFGAMGACFVWLATAIGGSGNLLTKAVDEIKVARTEIGHAKAEISGVKIHIDSAQKVLGTLRLAAENAKDDLAKLKTQREKISSDIAGSIANSKKDLERFGSSIQDLLSEQNQTIKSLDSINIRHLIVVPTKYEKQ